MDDFRFKPKQKPTAPPSGRAAGFLRKDRNSYSGGVAEGVKSRLGIVELPVVTSVVAVACWVITALARPLVWLMIPAAITMAARTTTAAIPTHSMVTRPSSFFTYLTRLFTKLFIVQFPFICFSLDTHGIIHSQILRILQWIILLISD